jgi:hypothetical protein
MSITLSMKCSLIKQIYITSMIIHNTISFYIINQINYTTTDRQKTNPFVQFHFGNNDSELSWQ